MICACTHQDCYFIFRIDGRIVPDRCPDCGNRTVHPASPDEIAWFYQEHREARTRGRSFCAIFEQQQCSVRSAG